MWYLNWKFTELSQNIKSKLLFYIPMWKRTDSSAWRVLTANIVCQAFVPHSVRNLGQSSRYFGSILNPETDFPSEKPYP